MKQVLLLIPEGLTFDLTNQKKQQIRDILEANEAELVAWDAYFIPYIELCLNTGSDIVLGEGGPDCVAEIQAILDSTLNNAQRAAINSVASKGGGFNTLMSGTRAVDGKQICFALTIDEFDPLLMAMYGLDWEIIGMAQWDGEQNEVLVPVQEETFLKHMVPVVDYDKEGNVTSETPATEVSQTALFGGVPAFF